MSFEPSNKTVGVIARMLELCRDEIEIKKVQSMTKDYEVKVSCQKLRQVLSSTRKEMR